LAKLSLIALTKDETVFSRALCYKNVLASPDFLINEHFFGFCSYADLEKRVPYFSQFGIVVSQRCRQIQTSKELNAGLEYHRVKLLTLILFGEFGLRLWVAYKKIKKPEKVTIPSLRGQMPPAHGHAASYLGG